MTQQIQDAYIVDAYRTPVGKAPRGKLKNVRPDDLLVHVLKGLMDKYPQVDKANIDDVITGCAMPEAEQGMNTARISLLLAGFPESVAGVTVNRFCASGLQAVSMAADRVRLGEADLMVASGVESMSMIPMSGNKVSLNPAIYNTDVAIAYGMGLTAEEVANRWNVSREQQDEFALQSHIRALQAQKDGTFNNEILPFSIPTFKTDASTAQLTVDAQIMTDDEGPRAASTIEALAKLRAVFAVKGSVTAGNSSQMSDGAGAVLIASEQALKDYDLTPIAKFKGFAVSGVSPDIMGVGPIKAIPKVLKQTQTNQQDLNWIELNEAFAAQSLAVINELGLNPETVNPLGGAIALGHPLGATGAIRTATLIHAMKRDKTLKQGMITMCIGTGMGAAGIFERV